MTRAWSLVIALLVASVALAGCAKKTDNPPTDTTPTGNGTTSTSTIPTGNATPPTPAPKPTVAPVKEAGTIQGPYDDSAKITLPLGAPKSFTAAFNLTGAQAGAPATAVVQVQLLGPDSKVIKSAVVGLGQAANSVKWDLTASDAALPGDYTLKMTQQAPPGPVPTGIPSGGVANFDLFLAVEY